MFSNFFICQSVDGLPLLLRWSTGPEVWKGKRDYYENIFLDKNSLINNFKFIHTSVGVSIIIFILHHYPRPRSEYNYLTIELTDIYYQNVWLSPFMSSKYARYAGVGCPDTLSSPPPLYMADQHNQHSYQHHLQSTAVNRQKVITDSTDELANRFR